MGKIKFGNKKVEKGYYNNEKNMNTTKIKVFIAERVNDNVENLEDLVLCQKNTKRCVANSFANGLIAIEGNYILESASNKEKTLSMMNDLVNKIYEDFENTRLKDEDGRLLPTVMSKFIESHFDKYCVEIKKNHDFGKIRKLLESSKAFISFTDESRNHQLCIYNYEDGEYYFKDSFGSGNRYSKTNEETEELLKDKYIFIIGLKEEVNI